MKINLENFAFVKERGEELYKSFVPVKCPYFNDLVYFNAQGLEHLKFKRRFVERVASDQYMRFKLLYLAPQILKLSRTVQGVMLLNTTERVLCNGRRQWMRQSSVFYEFIAVIDDVRARLVVKRIENGQFQFWSIIPFWKQGANTDRQLFTGNLSDD